MKFTKPEKEMHCFECILAQKIFSRINDDEFEDSNFLYCPRSLTIKSRLDVCDQNNWEN